MYNLLKGKKGIIFGALDENSIAWKTAERVHEEGGFFFFFFLQLLYEWETLIS